MASPKRKKREVHQYTRGPTGGFVPPKRIKKAWRAAGTNLSLKRWIAGLDLGGAGQLGVEQWRAGKAAA